MRNGLMDSPPQLVNRVFRNDPLGFHVPGMMGSRRGTFVRTHHIKLYNKDVCELKVNELIGLLEVRYDCADAVEWLPDLPR